MVDPNRGPDAPVLLVHWESVVGALLDRTADFPKAHRPTFAARVENVALDIHERLVRARWSPREAKARLLDEANAELAVLRALLRLSFERRLLARGPYETLIRDIDEAGRMLGGWIRSLEAASGGLR